LGKTGKKLEIMERRTNKRTKNYRNNKREKRKNQAGKLRAQGVNRRR